MAFVINRDGTISTLDVEFDAAGNMRLKKVSNSEDTGTSRIDWKKYPQTESISPKIKKKKKHKNKKKNNGVENNSIITSNANEHEQKPIQATPVQGESIVTESKKDSPAFAHIGKFLTRQSIDRYFDKHKLALRPVSMKTYTYAKSILKYTLWDYFEERFRDLEQYLGKLKEIKEEVNKRGKKHKQNKTKEKKRNEPKRNTIGDIAKISSLDHHTKDTNSSIVGSINKGRHP